MSIRIAWTTDLHLDSADQRDTEQFCDDVLASDVGAILIGGDIAHAKDVVYWLEFLDSRLRLPIYYVLGNHDYYGSDITTMRSTVRNLDNERLRWLPAVGRIQLSQDITLVGHGGWGDCRIGDLDNFEVLNDYIAIQDLWETVDRDDVLAGFSNRALLRHKLGALGDEAAEILRPDLLAAAEAGAAVLVLTHVPPFRESCWHDGGISEETWLPGFTCKAMGDLLMSVAESHPDSRFTVLCGHTHGYGYVRMCPNLEVHTGFGDYGSLCFRIVHVNGKEIKIEPPT
jgi:predicted MPP superfamily phosphohydrolase